MEAMEKSWVPRFFRPDFTWPRPLVSANLMTVTPPTPSVSSPTVRRIWGLVHRLLGRFSRLYCSWFGIACVSPIFHLPFGLVLKWSERTSIEEAIATQMARAGGLPVPKVLCYGEHPSDFRKISILMTRLPGWDWYNRSEQFEPEEEQPWFGELCACLHAMRQWKSPFKDKQVCSVIGTNILSQRVPHHAMGPFKTERELHEYLLYPSSSHAFSSMEEYEATVTRARKIFDMPHQIVFTHGDLKAHNIMFDDDYHLSGFLDWESAGWCPEYWEFTTAMRYGTDTWWYQAMSIAGGDQYMAELDCDVALNNITVDSYVGW